MMRLTSRVAAASVLAVSLVALSGCMPVVERTFTFADGADLEEGTTIKWKDGLASDPAWEVDGETSGNDASAYRRTADDCVVGFTASSDMNYGTPFADDDDLDASNGVMNLVIEFATSAPTTGTFRLDSELGTEVEMRQMEYAQDDTAGIIAGRSFDTAGATVMLFASCPDADDLESAFEEALAKNAVVITP